MTLERLIEVYPDLPDITSPDLPDITSRLMAGDAFRNYMKYSLDFPISDNVQTLCDQFKALLGQEKYALIRLGRKSDMPYFIDLNNKIDDIAYNLDMYVCLL